MTNDLELGPLVQATPNTVLPDFNPRVHALWNGEFPEFRVVGLALELERELQVQTDLVAHWKAKALAYKAKLVWLNVPGWQIDDEVPE